MRFLVVTPHGQALCYVRITSNAEETVDGPFEVWELRSGKQLRYANLQMARDLKQYHMAGRFEGKAMYALNYDEMVEMLRAKLGPTDKDRYVQARSNHDVSRKEYFGKSMSAVLGSLIGGFRLLGSVFMILGYMVKYVVIAIAGIFAVIKLTK